jgi:hypothetical protein
MVVNAVFASSCRFFSEASRNRPTATRLEAKVTGLRDEPRLGVCQCRDLPPDLTRLAINEAIDRFTGPLKKHSAEKP